MGEVYVRVRLSNAGDVERVRRGLARAEDVRASVMIWRSIPKSAPVIVSSITMASSFSLTRRVICS